MTPQDRRDYFSMIATNAAMLGMAAYDRPTMTRHDAKTRDAFFELLMNMQPTKPTEYDPEKPALKADPDSEPDQKLNGAFDRLLEQAA